MADDAERSLRDLWGIPVDTHRVCLTRDQIDEFGLEADFNPAKTTSTRFRSFVERTGSDDSWELESLHPSELSDLLKAAIEANLDMAIFDRVVEQERTSRKEIADFRGQIIESLDVGGDS